MASEMIKISASGIAKTYETKSGGAFEAVRGVDLSVKENEFLVVLGPGRCGKTTLLNILAGLETPSAGGVLLDGIEQGRFGKIGFVFQRTALFPWSTVLGNVELGLKLKGVPKKERQEKARYFINLVGLSGFETAFPHQLSGGMKQRVGIARAYCNNPEVLLMDEPFGQLDAQTRYQMEDEILRIWEKEKRTIVFVTNNIEEAVYLGDRIVLLSKCPAQVKEIYDIGLERPRNYMDQGFIRLRQQVSANTDLAL